MIQKMLLISSLLMLGTGEEWENDCEYNLCTSVENYPGVLIQHIAEKGTNFSAYFGNNVAPSRGTHFAFGGIRKAVVSSRNGPSKCHNLCPTKTRTMYPRKAKDEFDRWKVLVNVGRYKQSVTFDACVQNTSCFGEEAPLGYSTYCEQQYIKIKMVALDDSNQLSLPDFKVPSACSCVYSEDTYD